MKAPGTSLGTRQLFVYWKLDAEHLVVALAALKQAQGELTQALPGLSAQRFTRSGEDRPATVMEVYAREASRSAAGLNDDDLRLIDRTAAAAVSPWVQGIRHLEVFDAVPP